jgi:hypothetical protein
LKKQYQSITKVVKIPTTFQLVNTTWNVEGMPEEVASAGNMHGDSHRSKTLIRLYVSQESDIEDDYCHELAHALLEFTTRPKLSKDEKFVQSLGEVLCQYMNTAKGTFPRE